MGSSPPPTPPPPPPPSWWRNAGAMRPVPLQSLQHAGHHRGWPGYSYLDTRQGLINGWVTWRRVTDSQKTRNTQRTQETSLTVCPGASQDVKRTI